MKTKREILDEWLLIADTTNLKEGDYTLIENAMEERRAIKDASHSFPLSNVL